MVYNNPHRWIIVNHADRKIWKLCKFSNPCGIFRNMKVLKSPRARKIFADLASQGQLSAFVASTTTIPQDKGEVKVREFKTGSKSIKTRVINRYDAEEALPA